MTNSFKFISFLIFLFSFGCGQAQDKKDNPARSASTGGKITVKLCGNKPDEIWLNITKSKTETAPSLLQLDAKNPSRQFDAKGMVQADAGLLTVYSNSYKFLPGDSICVEFVKNPKGKYRLPFLSVSNRKSNATELNFYYFLNLNILGINNYDFSSSKNKGTSKASLLASKLYLDSIYNKKIVSDSFWKETSTEMNYMYYNALLSEYRNGKISAIKEIPPSAYNDDSLIENWTYRGFLIKYLEFFLMKSKNWNDVDYELAYSKVPGIFKGKTKEYLMYYALNKMNSKNKTKFNAMLVDFKSKVTDNEYVISIEKNYKYHTDDNTKGTAILESLNQGSQDYKKLISTLKGKVVYVDLWASWCSPCRASMGDSQNLREKYSKENISFVYVSIDEKRTAWEEAVKEEMLSSYPLSFLLRNVKESPLLKELGIKAIPRYVIYDKQGNLVDGDAPNPGSKDLETALAKYLKDSQ